MIMLHDMYIESFSTTSSLVYPPARNPVGLSPTFPTVEPPRQLTRQVWSSGIATIKGDRYFSRKALYSKAESKPLDYAWLPSTKAIGLLLTLNHSDNTHYNDLVNDTTLTLLQTLHKHVRISAHYTLLHRTCSWVLAQQCRIRSLA
jgi:hypothetical protein